MKGTRLFHKLKLALSGEDYQASYAQCGEDLLLQFLFSLLHIEHPTYLDIGAHHPVNLSNTHLFYRTGSRGVCIEPDPTLIEAFRIQRPEDKCLNLGIGSGDSRKLDFFVFDDPTLNTFSETVKEEQVGAGRILRQTLTVPVVPIDEVIREHFPAPPNFISLDTEGMDLEILQSLDFRRYRPEAFCIETLTNIGERKMTEIIDFMVAREYMIYADTYINTVFVDRLRWSARLADQAISPK